MKLVLDIERFTHYGPMDGIGSYEWTRFRVWLNPVNGHFLWAIRDFPTRARLHSFRWLREYLAGAKCRLRK